MSREIVKDGNTIRFYSAFDKNAFRKDEVQSTITLAQEIGLEMIKLSGTPDQKDVPIRLGQYEFTQEDGKEVFLFNLDIDLDKDLEIPEEE